MAVGAGKLYQRSGSGEHEQPVRDPGSTLVELFLHQVASQGERPAMFHRVNDEWAAITWNEYGQRAHELAAYFISVGLEEQDHVAIWSFNRPEFMLASTATMLSRGCSAPLYQTLSREEAAYVLGHSDAPIAVVENATLLADV